MQGVQGWPQAKRGESRAGADQGLSAGREDVTTSDLALRVLLVHVRRPSQHLGTHQVVSFLARGAHRLAVAGEAAVHDVTSAAVIGPILCE